MRSHLPRKVEHQIDRETCKGLENIQVPILELTNIANVARLAFAKGEDIAAAVRAYALTIGTDTGRTA